MYLPTNMPGWAQQLFSPHLSVLSFRTAFARSRSTTAEYFHRNEYVYHDRLQEVYSNTDDDCKPPKFMESVSHGAVKRSSVLHGLQHLLKDPQGINHYPAHSTSNKQEDKIDQFYINARQSILWKFESELASNRS